MGEVILAVEGADDPLIITHRHADRDSLGAALGLRTVLDRGTICTPDGIAGPAQSLLEASDQAPVTESDLGTHDLHIVVDAPSAERIAPAGPDAPILIDHHEPGDLLDQASAALVDTDARATAELVAQLIKRAEWELTPAVALPLAVGVLDDTGFLASASPATVQTAVTLLAALGDRTRDLPPLIDRTESKGERTAQALATLRATGYRAGDYIVAVTHVGGYETAATHALRDAGIDLVAVCSEQGDQFRVTARGSERLTDQLNLGSTVLPGLATEFGGEGGGHAEAGVAHLPAESVEAIEATLIEHIEKELEMTFSEI